MAAQSISEYAALRPTSQCGYSLSLQKYGHADAYGLKSTNHTSTIRNYLQASDELGLRSLMQIKPKKNCRDSNIPFYQCFLYTFSKAKNVSSRNRFVLLSLVLVSFSINSAKNETLPLRKTQGSRRMNIYFR